MAYALDQFGNEVDEQGYLREGVEAWGAHGIYPPPIAGDASNPLIVALHRALLASGKADTLEDRVRHLEHARELADRIGAQHNIGAQITRASTGSRR